MIPAKAHTAFVSIPELRDYLAEIDDSYFDRELAVRVVGGSNVTVEIMLKEYKNPRDTDTLIHFGVGPASRQRALKYLDALIEVTTND